LETFLFLPLGVPFGTFEVQQIHKDFSHRAFSKLKEAQSFNHSFFTFHHYRILLGTFSQNMKQVELVYLIMDTSPSPLSICFIHQLSPDSLPLPRENLHPFVNDILLNLK